MNKTEREYSIVAIRDTFRESPDRFLVYYDEGWKCWFFPNYPTKEKENEKQIAEKLGKELEIENCVTFIRKGDWTNEKYSTEHEERRTYHHTLYEVVIYNISKDEQCDTFVKNGKQYRWMTLDEMAQDADIQEKNMDVVEKIKVYFA